MHVDIYELRHIVNGVVPLKWGRSIVVCTIDPLEMDRRVGTFVTYEVVLKSYDDCEEGLVRPPSLDVWILLER